MRTRVTLGLMLLACGCMPEPEWAKPHLPLGYDSPELADKLGPVQERRTPEADSSWRPPETRITRPMLYRYSEADELRFLRQRTQVGVRKAPRTHLPRLHPAPPSPLPPREADHRAEPLAWSMSVPEATPIYGQHETPTPNWWPDVKARPDMSAADEDLCVRESLGLLPGREPPSPKHEAPHAKQTAKEPNPKP